MKRSTEEAGFLAFLWIERAVLPRSVNEHVVKESGKRGKGMCEQ